MLYVVAAITGKTIEGGGFNLSGAPFIAGVGLYRRCVGRCHAARAARPAQWRCVEALGRRAREAGVHEGCARQVRPGIEIRAELQAAQGSARGNRETEELIGLPRSVQSPQSTHHSQLRVEANV